MSLMDYSVPLIFGIYLLVYIIDLIHYYYIPKRKTSDEKLMQSYLKLTKLRQHPSSFEFKRYMSLTEREKLAYSLLKSEEKRENF